MKQEQVIELAKQVGAIQGVAAYGRWDGVLFTSNELTRFASLVEQATLEKAADVVENYDTPDCGGWTSLGVAEEIRNLAKDSE